MSLTACRETEWKGTGITINISLVTVGKVKEKYYRDAIAEYAKRLSRYCKLEIIEVADEKTPDKASETEEDQIKQKEAEIFGMMLTVLRWQLKVRRLILFPWQSI